MLVKLVIKPVEDVTFQKRHRILHLCIILERFFTPQPEETIRSGVTGINYQFPLTIRIVSLKSPSKSGQNLDTVTVEPDTVYIPTVTATGF